MEAAPIYREGDLIFVPHEEDGFMPARAAVEFQKGKAGKVRLSHNDMEHSVSAKESLLIERMDVQSFEDVDDMISLKVMNDASLLHNLRMRYTKERKQLPMEIYTNIGSILVSINPYKDLGLYTSEKEEQYLNAGTNLSKLPPHVFKVAETAYQLLKQEDKDQSAVITGESGAGKTEATKQFLQYISERSRRNQSGQTGGFDTSKLRKKIMESNPFLEAFGNAKTLRNDNSSRFGKMLEMYFETGAGVIIGAKITNYLLEKSRVTLVQEGERNYHIFYQLCAASSTHQPDFKKKYRLATADLFKYTLGANKGLKSLDVDDTNDAEIFKETVQAMLGLGMTEEDLDTTWKVCAGILHLGNLVFVPNDKDMSTISDDTRKTALQNAADMFEVEAAELEDALLRHPTQDTFVAHTVVEAEAARDAFAKHLYDKLFDHLISNMNNALSMSNKAKNVSSVRMLGVLDIFGFETFARNSFEQMCINFCNEKLQAFFNFHVFKKEQEEYVKEGINAANVGFYDNQGVVDAIGDVGSKTKKGKNLAIMTICDDQCLRGAMATDQAFLTAVLNQAKNLSDKDVAGHYLFKPKIQEIRKKPFLKTAFVIRHFAGDVAYNVEGFLEKNLDTLRENLRMVAGKSKSPLLTSFFPDGGVGVVGRQGKYKKTLGNKFQFSLNRLMEQLNHTTPQFVRTIKPNDLKDPGYFDASKIYKQLREAGLLEVCKIRKLGYPIRKSHSQFMYDYLCLDKSGKDVADLCAKLEAAGKLTYIDKEKSNPNWQIGKTKVFLRVEQANELEHMRADALKEVIAFLHRFARRAVFRLRVKAALEGIKLIKKGQTERNPELLQAGLDVFLAKGPLYSKLPIVLNGLELMKDLRVQLDLIRDLQAAMQNDDMGTIKVKLQVAYGLEMNNHKVVKAAEEKLKKFATEKAVKEQLDAAIGTQNLKELAAAIEFANEKEFTHVKQYKMATHLLETLKKREELLEKLREALKSGAGVDELAELVTQLRAAGCPDDHYLIIETVKKGELILETNKKKEHQIAVLEKQLKRAIKKKELKKLRDLASAAIQLNYTGPLLAEAMQLITALGQRQELLDEVAQASRVLREKSKMPSGIEEKDLVPLKHALKTAASTELDLSQEIQVQEGEELIQQMLDQLRVQEDIGKALAKATPSSYYDVLEKVQRLGLQTREADEICQKVRELEMLKAKADAITNDQIAEQTIIELKVPNEEERKAHMLKRSKVMYGDEFKKLAKKAAKSRDLSMGKYFKVRSDADFVSREPRYAKEAKLHVKHVYSAEDPISKSIIEMDDIQEHKAVQINQMMLKYCDGLSGNKKDAMEAAMSFIVCHGISDQVLADEVYIQLARHLTANPNALSKNKAWYLMCLCTTYFGASERFLPYILHFLQDSMSDAGLEGNYARYSLVQLSASQEFNPREIKFKPGSEEIKSFFKRPPVLAQLELLNRSIVEIPMPPDMKLRDLSSLIREKTGIMIKSTNPEWSFYIKAGKRPPKLSYKVRLQNFYRKYKPENLANVDNILEYYKGHEEALFAELVEVGDYGPEPTAVIVGPQAKKKKKKKNRERATSGQTDDEEETSSVTSSTSKMSSFSAMSSLSMSSVFSTMSAFSTFGKKLFKRARGLSTVDINDLETPVPKIPWPVPWWVYLGDIMGVLYEQDRVPVLSYRRRILKTKGKPDENLYLQLSRDFVDGYLAPYTEGENAKLSVMILAVRMLSAEKDFPYGDRNKLVKAGILRCIPKPLKRAYAKDKTWLDAYLTVATEKSNELKDYNDPRQIRQKFFEECVNFPTYGMSFFFGQLLKGNMNAYVAKNQPTDEDDEGGMIRLGVSKQEIALFKGGKKIRSFYLDDVVKYSNDGTTFTFEVKKQSQKKNDTEMFEAQLRDTNVFGNRKTQLGTKQKRRTFKTLKNMVSSVASVFKKQTETFQIYTLQTQELFDVMYLFKLGRKSKT